MTRHYLDHASTSPVRPEAVGAMVGWLRSPAADPSRSHAEGLRARAAVEEAREQVAALVGARSREVVFTSGATEAIAAAVWGASERGRHVVVPAVEHSAVREASARAGEVTVVGVDRTGRVDPGEVLAAVRPDTALVHVQWGNHEVGTVQPVAEVVAGCRERGVLVHVDAAQAVGHVPVAFDDLGADLLSLSGHKLGGPPGVGALLVRRGLRLRPLLVGGDQERARRAGLENVPAVAGLGAAAEAVAGRLDAEAAEAGRLTGRVAAAAAGMDGVEVYGDPDHRLPHVVCLGLAGVEPQPVLIGLDRAGIAVHSGNSCSSEALEPSPVLAAMGVDAARSLRVSVGWSTTDADVDAFLAALPPILADLRALARQA
ncbi:MAG TPA: cysteine desulfurase family protein [Acidimicrobiales bacterium]